MTETSLKPCHSPYCECSHGKCTHPGYYDARHEPVRTNADRTVAVDPNYFWQPMSTCPRAVKVQLLGAGGVASYGQYHGEVDTFWVGWAPLPKKPEWMK